MFCLKYKIKIDHSVNVNVSVVSEWQSNHVYERKSVYIVQNYIIISRDSCGYSLIIFNIACTLWLILYQFLDLDYFLTWISASNFSEYTQLVERFLGTYPNYLILSSSLFQVSLCCSNACLKSKWFNIFDFILCCAYWCFIRNMQTPFGCSPKSFELHLKRARRHLNCTSVIHFSYCHST